MNVAQDLQDLKHPDVETRLRAIKQLGMDHDQEHLEILIEFLKSSEWRVRKEAILAICQYPPAPSTILFLINVLQKTADLGEKNGLVEIFIHFGKSVVSPLMSHFNQMAPDAKKLCLDIFGEIGDREASSLLIQCLRESHENIRIAAIEALGKLKENRAVDALVPFLSSENNLLSFAAIKSLEQIGDARAVEAMVRLLGKNILDRPVLKALGQLGDLSALNPIVSSLQNGSPKIRKAAIESLMTLQEKISKQNEIKIIGRLREIYNKDISLFLVDLLKNPQEEESVRRAAIRILGWMCETMSVPLLVPLLEKPFREEVLQAIVRMKRGAVDVLLQFLPRVEGGIREGVIICLGEIGDRKAVLPLLKWVTDPVGHVRQSLAVALGKLGDSGAVKGLIQLLDDPYPNVQEAAIQSLRKFKDRSLISECINLFNHEKPNLRRNGIRLIGLMKAKDAVPHLALSLKDQDPLIRKESILALKAMDNQNIEEWVIYSMADESADVRLAALSCFEDHPDLQIEKYSETLKKDASIWVRSSLARILGKTKTELTKKDLIELFNDPVGAVQIHAIESLSRYHDHQLAPLFLEKLQSVDCEVQCSAILALGELEEEALGTHLEKFLDHENWSIRSAAVRTMGKLKVKSAFSKIQKISLEDPDKLVRQSAQFAIESLLG